MKIPWMKTLSVEAQALSIYDNVARTLRMSGSAWLSEGTTQFTGCDLIYDLNQRRITSGSSDCGEDLQIIFVPPLEETQPEPDTAL